MDSCIYCGSSVIFRNVRTRFGDQEHRCRKCGSFFTPGSNPEFRRSLWNPRRTVSWYVDETYLKVKGEWKYLYRAVDRNGEILDVMLPARRNKKAARRFFVKTLKAMGVKPERI